MRRRGPRSRVHVVVLLAGAAGALGIASRDDDAVGSQIRNIGERIADKHAGRHAARSGLQRIGIATERWVARIEQLLAEEGE